MFWYFLHYFVTLSEIVNFVSYQSIYLRQKLLIQLQIYRRMFRDLKFC